MQIQEQHDIQPVTYNDLYFRIIVSLIAAHVIVVIGENATLFQLLVNPDYYRSLFLSFLIAFLLVNLVYWVTRKLDKKFDWKLHTVQRSGLQLFFGLLLPAIAAFILAYFYFKAFGYDIRNTWYLRYDYPVIVLMLILLNVYYLAFYFYRKWQLSEERTEAVNGAVNENGASLKDVIIVSKGAENIPLKIGLIAYVFHDGQFNFIRTFEKEDYLITQTLDELQRQLPGKQFFRANRQMLVSFDSCKRFEPLEHGKLELIVNPPAKENIVISQKRAKDFKEWLSR